MTTRFPFSAFPNGWFRVAYSDELPPGGVKPLHYFGKDLVLFRTEDGKPQVFDAHCPHLGAHLGYGGKVNGNTIQCPFHGWCFDRQGECVKIPYSTKVPPKAKIQPLPVCEFNGLIMVYYHSQSEPPSWQMPGFPGWNSLDWTPFLRKSWKIRTHPQEMAENAMDTAHMLYLHGQSFRAIEKAEFEIDGTVLIQRLRPKYRLSIFRELGIDAEGLVEISCYGLGIQVSYALVKTVIEFHTLTLFLLTPIDEEFLDVHVLISIKNVLNKAITNTLRSKIMAENSHNLHQDIPVWENKIYYRQPLLSEADGPIMPYRYWSKQFYSYLPEKKSSEFLSA
ncbi:Rieske 2Fe-2S domain-containing protein [Calothrix rhizosoleniae]|uniref:Rieske 2Fe-2S domain-containing protein n=1 Tax=Calothrix rhizosoleniae TaxID=888997 RepID=UPI000B49A5CE|nr:aromatic ring-hydroxylating dioxygenase subunit alpha [Calothrix rhizosoleniae]